MLRFFTPEKNPFTFLAHTHTTKNRFFPYICTYSFVANQLSFFITKTLRQCQQKPFPEFLNANKPLTTG